MSSHVCCSTVVSFTSCSVRLRIFVQVYSAGEREEWNGRKRKMKKKRNKSGRYPYDLRSFRSIAVYVLRKVGHVMSRHP